MPELLHPGAGHRWWGGTHLAVQITADADTIWVRGDTGWHDHPLAPVLPGPRIGHVKPPLWPEPRPLGARRARSFDDGTGFFWLHDGWAYRWEPARRPSVVGHVGSGAVQCGPHGALIGWGTSAWGAAPRRSRVTLEAVLEPPSVRFSPDGKRVAGLSDVGPVCLSLIDGRILDTYSGQPIDTEGTILRIGAIYRGDRVLLDGVHEASWDREGPLLAGPGGRVWDLRTGLAQSEDVVLFGATVIVGARIYTVDWDEGVGHILRADGTVEGRFSLPLHEDDVIVGGARIGDEALFVTAERRGFSVSERTVTETSPHDVAEKDVGEAVIDGIRWRWSTEGWLLRG